MKNRIRTLVVDDSGFVVSTVTKRLETDPEIEVVGSARDGKEALNKIQNLKPDVITLDVVMPEMDGLAVLEHIMAEQPTPVIMLSALTSEGAETTIRALELGAVDFFLKPSMLRPIGNDEVSDTLVEKVKRAAGLKIKPFASTHKPLMAIQNKGSGQKEVTLPADKCFIIVIGSSTGGPRALMQLIPALPKDFPAAILVVQHMPPLFTKSLAERLDHSSQIKVLEASSGSLIMAGQVLLAPGGYHMVASKGARVTLNQDPPVLGVRPSIDITMKSVAEAYNASSVGVILTGMGSDGTLGASYIKAAGGIILAEDQSTCAVYGMPQSVVKFGYADQILPLPQIAPQLIQMCCGN
jgi:two-component system chemotaxis response regulator CheB